MNSNSEKNEAVTDNINLILLAENVFQLVQIHKKITSQRDAVPGINQFNFFPLISKIATVNLLTQYNLSLSS